MDDSHRPFVIPASVLPNPDPPVPVAAFYDALTLRIRVVFDKPLIEGPVHATIWAARALDRRIHVWWMDSVGNECRGRYLVGNFDAGSDFVSYLPPPFDVRSLDDVPAARFLFFPMQPEP